MLSRAWQALGFNYPDTVAEISFQTPGEPHPGDRPNINIGAGPEVRNFPLEWAWVDEQRALGIPTLWRCVFLIAGTIAAFPFHAFRSREEVEPTPTILAKPSPTRTRSDVIFQLMYGLLMHGNAIGLLSQPDRLGHPTRLKPWNPTLVAASEADGEILAYAYKGELYDPEEIFHVRGLQIPGAAFGVGVLEAHQMGLSLNRDMQIHASGWFRGAAVPSGVIKSQIPNLSQEQSDDIKARWQSKIGGPRPEPAVLDALTDFKPVASNPEQTQLLQSRQYGGGEIALMFGVPAHMVNAQQPGSSMTYTNTEQEGIDLLRWTLQWWVTQLEQSFSELIPHGQRAHFNTDALLRAATIDRYRAYEIALQKQAFKTVDEIRDLEDLEPMEEELAAAAPPRPTVIEGAGP